MPVVSGRLLDIVGAGVTNRRATLTVRLSSFSWTAGGDEIAPLRIPLSLAADGSFSVELLGNAALTPAGSFYILALDGQDEVALVVPDDAGPHDLRDLIVSSPPVPAQYLIGPGSGVPGEVTSNILTVPAGRDLSAHRVVVQIGGTLTYADPTNLAHLPLPLWMTLTAGSMGDDIQVLTFGEAVEPSWDWLPGGILLVGLNGTITQAYTPNAWARVLGAALDATSLFWNPTPPIALAS